MPGGAPHFSNDRVISAAQGIRKREKLHGGISEGKSRARKRYFAGEILTYEIFDARGCAYT